MLMGYTPEDWDQGYGEEGGVEIGDEVGFGICVISEDILRMSMSAKLLCTQNLEKVGVFTLVKKFELVHNPTVTSSRNIPSVRLATFPNPTPALKPWNFVPGAEARDCLS